MCVRGEFFIVFRRANILCHQWVYCISNYFTLQHTGECANLFKVQTLKVKVKRITETDLLYCITHVYHCWMPWWVPLLDAGCHGKVPLLGAMW